MGIHDRDWYRDELRKKQGYTERSSFRRSLGKAKRLKRPFPWAEKAMQALMFVVGVLVVMALFERYTRGV